MSLVMYSQALSFLANIGKDLSLKGDQLLKYMIKMCMEEFLLDMATKFR